MAYNDGSRGKGRPAGTRGGVKKYPADKNFGGTEKNYGRTDRKPYYGNKDGAERKPYYGNRDGAERKPYYGNKDGAERKPYYGNKDGAERKPYEGKGKAGGGRDPRFNRKKDYEKIPPRDTFVKEQVTEAEEAEADDAEDAEGYDPAAGLVIGRSAVRELLRSGRTVDKLLVHRGEREGSIVVLVAEAIEQGIPVVEVDKAKLDEMSGFVPHQGVIAMVAQKDYCSVEDILALAKERGETPLIVIADGITDPYNLGALIRCAEGVGAHGLIIPRRRAVGLTALVAKSSAGAMEHLAVAKVSNIAATVKSLKQAGIWCYAAEAGGKPHYETDLTGPCALIFGSEGDGVSRVVKQACDGVISIPMYGKVNSFNVSTAAAVVLCEAARQQHGKKNN